MAFTVKCLKEDNFSACDSRDSRQESISSTPVEDLTIRISAAIATFQPLIPGLKKQLYESNEREHIFEEYFLSIYQDILKTNSTHIILIVKDLKGFGDLLFALKLCDELTKNLSNTKIALVFENQATIEKVKQIAQEYPYYQNCYIQSELPEEFKNPANGLCIGCASVYCKGEVQYNSMGLSKDYPTLLLPEYNFDSKYFVRDASCVIRPTGLFKDGIFIDIKLIKIVEEDYQLAKDPLSHIPELIEKQLLTDIKPNGVSIEDYSYHTKLFFGYSHKTNSHKHFIYSVVHSEKAAKKNIDMILVLDNPSELEARFDENFRRDMKELGIGQIEIIGTPLNISSIIKLSSEGKTLRIIPRTKILHKDFETCLIMSQPLSLCSGDQSVSEAVSTNKIFLYEVYKHKIEFAQNLKWYVGFHKLNTPLIYDFFVKSMIFQELSEKEQSILSMHELLLNDTTARGELLHDKTKNDYEGLCRLLSNPEFIYQWNRFLKIIQQEQSLNNRIIPIVSRILATNIGKERLSALNKVLSDFKQGCYYENY